MLKKIKSFFGGGGEGSVRSPLFGMGELGNSFQIRPLEDGWNRNLKLDANSAKNIPAVRACVNQYSGAVSQCRPQHMKTDKQGQKTIMLDSPQARLLRKPNDYETFNQFIYNCVAEIMYHGESYACLIRDNRNVVVQMHRLSRGSCQPYITPDGTLFYSVGKNPMMPTAEEGMMLPARDVLHLRSFTPRHPLIGESPITAAAMAAGVNVALSQSQLFFFNQMSRPSGILSTDQTLTREQMVTLREAWENQSAGISQGKVPILGGGFKFQPLGVNAQDSELLSVQKMSIADIARVFSVPLPIIGELENSTMNNVQELISLFLSTGLGAVLENIEASFDKMFDFGKGDHINFDETALLRMDFKDRMDGLSKSVMGGILTPNEARRREGLHDVPMGDKVFMQAQMVPIDRPEPEPIAIAPQPAVEPEPDTIAPEDKKLIYLHELRKQING